jgi:penicillin-binding protein 2
MGTSQMDPSFNQPITRRSALRLLGFAAVGLGAMSVEVVRLAYMQLVNPTTFSQSPINPSATRPIPAMRGVVFDRSGRPLVANVPIWTLKIRPADLPASDRPGVVTQLAGLLGMAAADINVAIDSHSGSTFDLVTIKRAVPEPVMRLISEDQAKLPGTYVVAESRRQYPAGPLFSQILGYMGRIDAPHLALLGPRGYQPDDMIGVAGIEATYESALRGIYGQDTVQLDATGRDGQILGTTTNTAPGHSLRLTIDTVQQTYARDALAWGLETAHVTAGALIVMNPQTGEVLALASLPTYDDNSFADGIGTAAYATLLNTPGRPLLNHTVSEQYPPGSTYKLVTGTGALADNKITPETRVDTKAYLTIGTYQYPDWNHAGWGPINIFLGFGHSSDTFFYQLAAMLGIDRLAYWARQFGFGALTGIDIPAEVPGTVPTNQWKEDTLGAPIYPGEVYHAGIGQGYDEVTPIQLLNAYCALANGGRLYRPQIVRDIYAADGTLVRAFKPELIHKMDVPSETLRTMRQAARTVVTVRHTYNVVDMPIKVAGKTGTAEFGIRDAQGRLPFHDWGVFFLPKDPYGGSFDNADSELAVLVFVNDARTIGNSSTEIAKYFLQMHYGIHQDYRLPQLLQQGNFYGD